jgi:hypothetical protein
MDFSNSLSDTLINFLMFLQEEKLIKYDRKTTDGFEMCFWNGLIEQIITDIKNVIPESHKLDNVFDNLRQNNLSYDHEKDIQFINNPKVVIPSVTEHIEKIIDII